MRPNANRMCQIAAPACVLLLLAAGGATSAPFVPSSNDFVLEHLPQSRAGGFEMRKLHTALAQNPHDVALAISVARADIERAREDADPRWLGRAEAALLPWPAESEPPPPVMLLRAVILQSNHDFDGSLAELAYVTRKQPGLSQAWLVRASVHQVRADYAAALADCGRYATTALGLAPDTCTASIMSLTGHAPLALRALTLSLKEYPDEAAATRVWAMTLASETADRLDDPSAGQRFAEALQAGVPDPYLLGAWADWLLDHGRAAEVETLLAAYTRADPLLLRLALAEQRLGRPVLSVHVGELQSRFDAAHLRGDTVHQREEARFRLHLLHQPAEALRLAEANWGVQREPADARILLEAAIASHRPEAAEPVAAWMHENGVQDVALQKMLATTGEQRG